jgi:hypothetical protein
MWTHGGTLTYEASAVWDQNGGIVQHRGSRLRRIAFGYHRKVVAGAQAPAIRSLSPGQNWQFIRSFGRQKLTYGDPEEHISTHHRDSFTTGETDYEAAEPDAEQLKALGYIK